MCLIRLATMLLASLLVISTGWAQETETKTLGNSEGQHQTPLAVCSISDPGCSFGPSDLSAASDGPGAEMAFKMMLATQIITAVLAALIFGVLVFWAGYSLGRAQRDERR